MNYNFVTSQPQTQFLKRAQIFRDNNQSNPLIWYTSLATSNFSAANSKKLNIRPLFGLISYCLFELPFKSKKISSELDLIFATVFINNQGKIKEAFFGDLPDRLTKDKVNICAAGKIAWSYNLSLENKAISSFDYPVYLPCNILSKLDGITCIFQAIFSKFYFLDMDKTNKKLAKKEIWNSKFHSIIIGLFYQKMLKKIKNKNPNAQIIHPFEGNTWESSCSIIDEKSIGYQHNAILTSHHKIEKFINRPMPNKIITTGVEASKVLEEVSKYKKTDLIDGYSLRLNNIHNYTAKASFTNKIKNVVFLMQGGEEKNGVIDFLKTLQKHKSYLSITLRPHPAHPINFKCNELQLSSFKNLYEDILNNDVCLYTSSSAAFESIALGVPVVNINGFDDPLFACRHLHETAKTIDGLDRSFDYFENDMNFNLDSKKAKLYFLSYFTAQNTNTTEDFKKWLNL